MSDLPNRLRVSAGMLGREPTADLIHEAADAVEAAQARAADLAGALQGLVELSDPWHTVEFAAVQRTLTHARELLAASDAPATE
jgi:hypothetical protein